jgi:hypothetical protein
VIPIIDKIPAVLLPILKASTIRIIFKMYKFKLMARNITNCVIDTKNINDIDIDIAKKYRIIKLNELFFILL